MHMALTSIFFEQSSNGPLKCVHPACAPHHAHVRKSGPACSTIDGPARVSLTLSLSLYVSVSGFQVARRAAQPRQEGSPTNRQLFVGSLEPADARAAAHRLPQAHDRRRFHITSKRIHFIRHLFLPGRTAFGGFCLCVRGCLYILPVQSSPTRVPIHGGGGGITEGHVRALKVYTN